MSDVNLSSLAPLLGWHRYFPTEEFFDDIEIMARGMLDTPRGRGRTLDAIKKTGRARMIEYAMLERVERLCLGSARLIDFRDKTGADVDWNGVRVEVKRQGYDWWESWEPKYMMHFWRHRNEVDVVVTGIIREVSPDVEYHVLFKQIVAVPAVFDLESEPYFCKRSGELIPPLNSAYWRVSDSPFSGKEHVRLFDHRLSKKDGVGLVF